MNQSHETNEEEPPNRLRYDLPRDTTESVRLTAQHYNLVERQGWLLHPRIESALKDNPNPQIADVAGGTGIWSVAVANHLPHATVTALDISTEQYPPGWTAPSNTNFEVLDVLQPVPLKYQHRYDVVHVRLLLPAGPAADKEVFLSCFKTLLKPGGWLQWDELVYPAVGRFEPPSTKSPATTSTSTAADTSTVSPASLEPALVFPEDENNPVIQVLCGLLNLEARTSWFNTFDQVSEQYGFSHAEKFEVPPRRHLLKQESDQIVLVVNEVYAQVSEAMRAQGRELPNDAEVQAAIAQVQRDVAAGISYVYKWIVGIAKAT